MESQLVKCKWIFRHKTVALMLNSNWAAIVWLPSVEDMLLDWLIYFAVLATRGSLTSCFWILGDADFLWLDGLKTANKSENPTSTTEKKPNVPQTRRPRDERATTSGQTATEGKDGGLRDTRADQLMALMCVERLENRWRVGGAQRLKRREDNRQQVKLIRTLQRRGDRVNVTHGRTGSTAAKQEVQNRTAKCTSDVSKVNNAQM